MKKELQGIVLVLTSAMFYGSYGVWSRLMTGSFGEFSQAWTRGIFLLMLILIANKVRPFTKSIAKSDWKWFAVIALAGGINQAP